MHPVLADAITPFAEQVAMVSLTEAQFSPDSEHHLWSAQQVVEHLILSFQKSTQELRTRLKTGNSPAATASLLQWILKVQVCVWSLMSRGVPTTLALRPDHFVPQDGKALAARLLSAAEDLDKALIEARFAFGMRPCGYHVIYGPLRVEEWRVYHAVHCRHHRQQFEEAVRLARRRSTAGAVRPKGVEKPLIRAGIQKRPLP
jgi:hypothetical protein